MRLDASPIGDTGSNRIAELLKAHCRHSDVELLVNGEPCAFGFRLDGNGKQIPFKRDSLRGLAGRDRTIDRGEIRFLKDGIVVETQFLPQKYLGIAVIVSDSRFRTDLSSRKIIRDELFNRALKEATAAAESMGGRRKKAPAPAPRVTSKSGYSGDASAVVPTSNDSSSEAVASESAWLSRMTTRLAFLFTIPQFVAWVGGVDLGPFPSVLLVVGVLLFFIAKVFLK